MKQILKCAALLMAAALAATSCSQKAAEVSAEAEVIAVAATAASRGTLTHTTSYSGRISPAESVYIIGKASGTVSKTYFEVGDTVKAGDLLFEIDPADIMLSVNQAQAAYDVAAAQVALQTGSTLDAQKLQAEAQEEQAYLGYKSARDAVEDLQDQIDAVGSTIAYIKKTDAGTLKAAFAATKTDAANRQAKAAVLRLDISPDSYATDDDYKTALLMKLNEQSATLESSLEKAKSARKQAASGYNSASDAADLSSGKASDQAIAAADASLGQARAALEAAQAQVDHCRVTTPISGIVELKNVEVNGMSTPSTPAYVISNKDTMQVTFGVPAETSRKLEIGDRITVENGKITHNAIIVEIGTMIDQASGLFKIKANITDECGDLLTGITVKLTATTERAEDALLIPTAAIYYDEGSAYVYVVRGGTAVKTFVETGIFSEDITEITDGLDTGDLVITTWDSHLRDGMLVSVKEG